MLNDKTTDLSKGEYYYLSTAYLAPIEYYILLAKAEKIWIEQFESYCKQTYRNRTVIATANGLMDLSIPIEKARANKPLTKDMKISNTGKWQQNHWRSIETAYNSSPFFEYYIDDFLPFYTRKWTYLWDFNIALQETVLSLLDLETNIHFTQAYRQELPENHIDLRERISPKQGFYIDDFTEYYQVFKDKFGFQANLSIIDLLFNMGNESVLVLKR